MKTTGKLEKVKLKLIKPTQKDDILKTNFKKYRQILKTRRN